MPNRKPLAIIEGELGHDNFKKLRSIVKHFTCKEAIVMLALNGAPLARAADLTGAPAMIKSHAEFCREVCRCLRAVRRYKSLSETSGLLRVLVNNLRNQAGVLYQHVVAELAPDCVLENESYDWTRLKPGELNAIESRLSFEKISEAALDEAVALIFVSPTALFANHLCLFSFPAFTSQPPSDPLMPFLGTLGYDLESLVDYLNELTSLGEEKLVNRLNQMHADKLARITPPTGRVADFVFSASKDWRAFYSVCVEHFGDLIPLSFEEPKHWSDLVDNSRCVVALLFNQMIGRAFESAEQAMRQFAAVCECLRHRHAMVDSAEHHGLQERIKAVTIPYGACRADERKEFASSYSKSEQFWEFELACSPFSGFNDFDEATINVLEIIIDHIDRGLGDANLWSALDHFEGALSLGGTSKTLSESLETIWKVAALWTALEVRTYDLPSGEGNRTVPVADQIRKVFKRGGLSESESAKGVNLVKNLYDRRNDVVHKGQTRVDRDELTNYRNVVATLLGIELQMYADTAL